MNLLKNFLLVAVSTIAVSLAHADELTLYAYPSPFGINWDSPEQTAWSGLASEAAFDPRFKDVHSIGHVQIELNCDKSESGPAQYTFTGMTNTADGEFFTDLLNKGYGLGLLVGSFSGREELTSDIEADLPARYESARISFLSFILRPSTCQRVAQYLAEYKARGYDKIYGGLGDRPRYGEGAGCSAFGESVLEIAGVMDASWYQDWTRSIRIPESLIGGPLTGQDVPIGEVLFGAHAQTWATETEPGLPIFFWDPDRIYSWINEEWKTAPANGYTPQKRENALGLLIDRRELPTPTDSFWKND